MGDEDQDQIAPEQNIREILGKLVGRTVVDVTETDEEDLDWENQIYLMFDNGSVLKFCAECIFEVDGERRSRVSGFEEEDEDLEEDDED